MKEPIRIDFDSGKLKTPEHLYTVKSSISISHYIEFEIWQPQAAYGLTFADFYNQDAQQVKLFNEGKAAEGITIVVNRQQAMLNMKVPNNAQGVKVDKKHHAFLQIAALFLIEENEDMTKFDQEYQNTKIQDFLDSGVSYEDLFLLAVKLVPGLLAASAEVSRTTSQAATDSIQESVQGLKELLTVKDK
jgi:hypothetical protein